MKRQRQKFPIKVYWNKTEKKSDINEGSSEGARFIEGRDRNGRGKRKFNEGKCGWTLAPGTGAKTPRYYCREQRPAPARVLVPRLSRRARRQYANHYARRSPTHTRAPHMTLYVTYTASLSTRLAKTQQNNRK